MMQNVNKDILFVFPPAIGNLGVFKNHLGVSYLRASLLRGGIDSKQYLNDFPMSINETALDMVKDDPKIIGFTVYDANLSLALALSQNIKRINPEIKAVFGGPSATFGAKNILTCHEAIDVCVMGEAEETGTAIFEALLENKPFNESIKGVAFRKGGNIAVTTMPELAGNSGKIKDCTLDNSASPYLSGVLQDGRPGILSGRGCTHHCQYCCFAALGRKRLRIHSIERIIGELKCIYESQKRNNESYVVAIHDDAFTLMPDRAKEICKAIIENGLNMTFSCITRADAIDEELINLMTQAGFISLAFGLESAVPSVLRETGKVRSPDLKDENLEPEINFVRQVETSVNLARRYGMNVGVSIILGLPSETKEQGLETLKFLKKLPVHYYMHNFLWLFPGTPLWDTKENYGIDGIINDMGLPVTTKYAYDITSIKPLSKCSLENDAKLIKMLALDSMSSCDSRASDTGGLHYIMIDAGKLDGQLPRWLNEILDIGGIIVHRYPELPKKEADEILFDDRSILNDGLVPARHYIQVIHKVGKNGDKGLMIACSGVDLYRRHKPGLLSVSYDNSHDALAGWISSKKTECDYFEPSEIFNDPGVIISFIDEVREEGIFNVMKSMVAPPLMKYPGRWLKDKTPCMSLSRIEVDTEGNVRCCSNGKKIGVVGDSRDELKANLTEIMNKTEKRRGCERCENKNCPRCPFPGMEDSEYCRIMNEERKILDFLTYANICARMPFILESRRDRLGSD